MEAPTLRAARCEPERTLRLNMMPAQRIGVGALDPHEHCEEAAVSHERKQLMVIRDIDCRDYFLRAFVSSIGGHSPLMHRSQYFLESKDLPVPSAPFAPMSLLHAVRSAEPPRSSAVIINRKALFMRRPLFRPRYPVRISRRCAPITEFSSPRDCARVAC